MRFSVVTPTLDALPSLKRCIGSVRGQRGVDVQHIIRDGASRDGTAQWLSRDEELCWSSVPDGGMYEAIERGFDEADGEILSWLNADEQYLPGTLSRVASLFAEHPALDLVYGDVLMVDQEGLPLSSWRDVELEAFYVRNGFLYVASATMFFRRRLRDTGLLRFDTRYRAAADMDLLLRLLAAGIEHRKISAHLSLFGVHDQNLSMQPGARSEMEQVQREHGRLPSPLARHGVKFMRRMHRLLRGGYIPKRVSYDFATDEVPNYRRIHHRWVGGLSPLR